MKIWFDMDGTIADLYGVDNWLEDLIAEEVRPYAEAKPLLRLSTFAYLVNRLQNKGYEIGIISWLSKGGSRDYNKRVKNAKEAWLRKHLKSVTFNEIHIVEYGTPKQMFCSSDSDILFDDEVGNRESWLGIAYNETNIIEILKTFQEDDYYDEL